MKKYFALKCVFLGLLCLLTGKLEGQIIGKVDSNNVQIQQEAIYNRPFINISKIRTAVGGYVEGNSNYWIEDGIEEGFSMELRRFNIFLYSQIHPRIRFLSELEFEHGVEEIALETAQIDIELLPALQFRGGIVLPSIGGVNTNHDSPVWDFIERPISSTSFIPTTLSEVGFGVFGRFYPTEKLIFSYNLYLTNGLQDGIIDNESGRTDLSMGKSPKRFAEDNNGSPMVNARGAITFRKFGEIGLSYYGGIYNTFKMEGEMIDKKRKLGVFSLDFSGNVKSLDIRSELVYTNVDVPYHLSEIYGEQQLAGFFELGYPILKGKILGFKKAMIKTSLRLEGGDYNLGKFHTNLSSPIKDEILGFRAAVSFRPVSGTVLRLNYSLFRSQDALGNPFVFKGGIQAGIASYF